MELLRVAASGNALSGRTMTRVLGGFLVGGSDASSALIYDAATATGNAKFSLKAVANDMSSDVTFPTPLIFNTDISVTLAGTGAILYLMIE